MDYRDFATGFTAVNAAITMARTALDTMVETKSLSQLNQAHRALNDALQGIAALQLKNAELEDELRAAIKRCSDLEQAKVDKESYHLADVGTGTFVYTLKPGLEAGQPRHWLCVACFDKGKKSILQSGGREAHDSRYRNHTCPECRRVLRVHYARSPGKEAG